MFRRRFPPRKRPFPAGPHAQRPLPPAARAARNRLQLAHHLMAEGKAAEAAPIFDELADEAERRGIERAPQLILQAGRAWLLAGQSEYAVARLRRGLRLMHTMGQHRRLRSAGARVLSFLSAHDLAEEATALENELQEMLSQADSADIPVSLSRIPPHLPAKCPYCGGNVLPHEVDWIDDHRATCDYCGSILEAEK